MTGVGGAVKVSHALGAGNQDKAKQHFTSTIVLAAIIVLALTLFCLSLLEFIVRQLNSDPQLHQHVKTYLGTILWFYPAMMINIVFSIFIRAQGKPGLSLIFGVMGNILNLVLDYLMIAQWGMGLHGAALSSGISVLIPMSCGIFYFLSKHAVLQFTKFKWNWRDVGETLFNGLSEMVGQLSIGMTTWVFNNDKKWRTGHVRAMWPVYRNQFHHFLFYRYGWLSCIIHHQKQNMGCNSSLQTVYLIKSEAEFFRLAA